MFLSQDEHTMKEMQKCPLCQAKYSDITKVCPLKHCSNCGSLKVLTHKKRSFQTSRAKQNFVFLLLPFGFFVLVYGYLFVRGDLIPFLSIVAVFSAFFLGVLFKITIKNVNCTECNARNFPFVSNIRLDAIKHNGSLVDDDLTKKISKMILEGLSTEQRKHNKKDLMVRIASAVSLVIIAIFGTFFINSDDVMFGEIIDMIKSFQ
jgi:hypothetical protein